MSTKKKRGGSSSSTSPGKLRNVSSRKSSNTERLRRLRQKYPRRSILKLSLRRLPSREYPQFVRWGRKLSKSVRDARNHRKQQQQQTLKILSQDLLNKLNTLSSSGERDYQKYIRDNITEIEALFRNEGLDPPSDTYYKRLISSLKN